ncbi:MAG: FAD-dependent oxidoreductase [Oscillospiraceae bacterium]|nr:FAD-dependent oxidoreductase [Oscillospiraceae bacterium]
MHKSIWCDGTKLPRFEKLQGERRCDVLIIGGGLCGILCAKLLKDAGVDYILAEGRGIASGVTGNTTAKITSQHGLIYAKLLKGIGRERAKMYLDANERAIREYETLCRGVDCDFEKKSAYTYSLRDRARLEAEAEALERLGFGAELSETHELPFKTAGAVRFDNQAQCNPLKFIAHIAKGLNIFENTFIRDIAPHMAIADEGKIRAEKIIVVTHFPFINKHGSYFLKLFQHRSYVSAYENVARVEGMYVDEDKRGMSFRQYKDMLLIGGGGHRTGKQGGGWAELRSFANEHYPGSVLHCEWAAQDCMSLDGMPYIGRYSAKTPELYVATGFNKWGMTSSMVAAQLLCDEVLGRENECAAVFSPQRNMLKPQLFVNGFESGVNLLTPRAPRCPHLGCALRYNRAEHSWDCPCHGSRFHEDGRLIDNPATGDAKTTSEGK